MTDLFRNLQCTPPGTALALCQRRPIHPSKAGIKFQLKIGTIIINLTSPFTGANELRVKDSKERNFLSATRLSQVSTRHSGARIRIVRVLGVFPKFEFSEQMYRKWSRVGDLEGFRGRRNKNRKEHSLLHPRKGRFCSAKAAIKKHYTFRRQKIQFFLQRLSCKCLLLL